MQQRLSLLWLNSLKPRNVTYLAQLALLVALSLSAGCQHMTSARPKQVSRVPAEAPVIWQKSTDIPTETVYHSALGTIWVSRFSQQDATLIREAIPTATREINGYRVQQTGTPRTIRLNQQPFLYHVTRLVRNDAQNKRALRPLRYATFLQQQIKSQNNLLIEILVNDELSAPQQRSLDQFLASLVK